MNKTRAILMTCFWCLALGSSCFFVAVAGVPFLASEGQEEMPSAPSASQVTTIPQWSDIEYTTVRVFQQSAPSGSVTPVEGLSVPPASMQKFFYENTSLNATNIQTTAWLHFKEQFNVTCTSATAESDFVINYYPALANGSLVEGVRLFNNVLDVSYTKDNASLIESFLTYASVGEHFSFNMSAAVERVENVSLYTGANYSVQIEFKYPIQFKDWSMTSTHSAFPIGGRNATAIANYSQSFTLWSEIPLNVSFYLIPRETSFITNPAFRLGTTPFTADFNSTIGGYDISPGGGSVDTNNSRVTFTFGVPFTVGFTDTYVNRWHRDLVKWGANARSRYFKLDIFAGPEQYLLEKVQFNITDIDGSIRRPGTYSSPSTATSTANAQYSVLDEETGQMVTIQNGTRFTIGQMQKAAGRLDVGLDYSGTYNATFRILDEVRNPLAGAGVILYYHGERFGVRMAAEDPLVNPMQQSDALGVVTFRFLPEGNYSMVVQFQGWNHTQDFRVSKDQASISGEVVTSVPYQPGLLVSWTVAFGIVAVLGVVLVKKKK